MIINKGISLGKILKWSWHHITWLLILMGSIAALYRLNFIQLNIPWLPVSVVGTAVAFYVGFKNNQAYDRMWEARKIWGGIVNESRTWGMLASTYISNQFTTSKLTENELNKIKKRLVYRHIAWLYVHRSQLLVPTPWEHINQGGAVGKLAEKYRNNFGIGLIEDSITPANLKKLLPKDEYQKLFNCANAATQIIHEQSLDLQKLRESEIIEDFRHMKLASVLQSFYTLQGKNERIKKFPLPRQYANMSRVFIGIFILLLPFSMIPELQKIGEWGFWLSAPITALIGWVYVMMEIVGDYSENPFQGMANDIPMLSLCRTIEIDLREILGEKDLPPVIKPTNGILM